MNIRSEMETELLDRLQVADNSTLYTSARLTKLIQDAYIWATDTFIWLDLVKAKMTNSVASQEYYDYPDDFRSGTIISLELDGDDDYKRYNFEDYKAYKNNYTSSQKKMFANFGRQYFIHPTPSANGTNNLCIWGAVPATKLTGASDKTIFSDNKEEGNEAVIQKAMSVALKRIDRDASKAEYEEALATLAKLNRDEWKSIERDQRLDHPKFDVPDFFATGVDSVAPIGRFNYDPTI